MVLLGIHLHQILEGKDLHARGVASGRSGNRGTHQEARRRTFLAVACMAEEVVGTDVAAGRRRECPSFLRWQRRRCPLVLKEEEEEEECPPLLPDAVEASVALAAVHTEEDIVASFVGVGGSSWASFLIMQSRGIVIGQNNTH